MKRKTVTRKSHHWYDFGRGFEHQTHSWKLLRSKLHEFYRFTYRMRLSSIPNLKPGSSD